MANITIDYNTRVLGWSQLETQIRRALKIPAEVSGRALLAGGEILKEESQRICPVKTGNLRSAAYVKLTSSGVEVGYDTNIAPYALPVHENLQAHHEPPGQAKFLEDPSEYMRPIMFEAVAQMMAKQYKNWIRMQGGKVT